MPEERIPTCTALSMQVKKVVSLSDEEKKEILNKHPKITDAVLSLILMFKTPEKEGVTYCDWECDFSDVIFDEIR
jgi:hypothetical protein